MSFPSSLSIFSVELQIKVYNIATARVSNSAHLRYSYFAYSAK